MFAASGGSKQKGSGGKIAERAAVAAAKLAANAV